MKLKWTYLILSICLFSFSLQGAAVDTGNFTLKGAVVTSDGTMVPEFTVVVRPVADKPQLVLRKHFTDGTFRIPNLRQDRYQVLIYAPRHAGVKMDVNFPAGRVSASQYRVIVLPKMRNQMRVPGVLSSYTVSTKVLQQDISDKAREAYEKGVELHAEGNLDEALVYYGEALRNCPYYIQALTDASSIYILLNRPDAALTFLRRAQRFDGTNTIVRINTAVALMARRDFKEAMGLLQDVLRAEPRKSLPLYYIARVHAFEKRYAEAERHARLALSEDPGMIESWVMLINLALEQEKYDEARESLEHLRITMNNGLFTKFVETEIAGLGN